MLVLCGVVFFNKKKKEKKKKQRFGLPSLHSHSGASSRKGDGEKREDGGRDGGREGAAALKKMMRRLFLEAAD